MMFDSNTANGRPVQLGDIIGEVSRKATPPTIKGPEPVAPTINAEPRPFWERLPSELPPSAECSVETGADSGGTSGNRVRGSLKGFLEDLVRVLPNARIAGSLPGAGGDRSDIDQTTLVGRYEDVAAAVSAIPNSYGRYGYDEWVRFAVAIRAACEDEHAGLDLFEEFSERGAGPNETYLPETIYWSTHRPFGVGASWLFDEATKHGWTGRSTAIAAAVTDRWFDQDAAEKADEIERKAAPTIRAVPFVSADPITFPRRQSIYGGHLFRKYVSATVAPGGVGKSTLSIAEALAIATGKPLLGVPVLRPGRVWIWNGEDPREEIERRVLAAKMRFGLSDDDIGGRLFLNSGRDLPLVLASQTRDGTTIHTPVVDGLVAEMRARSIDVLIVDPFVSSHQVPESDNGAIDLVAKRWASIADSTNAAVELVHHSRKKADASAEIGPEDGRGASSLSNAARSVRTLAAMTPDEAKSLGIDDERRHRLFRFGGSKQNLAPRSDTTGRWMELVSQSLGNGGLAPDGVFEAADEVGVVMPYEAPALAPGRQDDLARFVAEMEPATWRVDPQARDTWIGVGVASALGLDVESDKGAIKTTISRLCAEKRIRPVVAVDRHTRKLRRFYERAEQGVFS